MDCVSASQWCSMLKTAAENILSKVDYLTAVDMKIGDGDHGEGMARGFTAVKQYLDASPSQYVNCIAKDVGIILIKKMGGASGVIFGTMFFEGADGLPNSEEMTIDQMISYFRRGERAIEKRGKVKPGMKTMVDALDQACMLMESKSAVCCEDRALEEIVLSGYCGAVAGAEATAHMISKRGRSKNFQEQTLGVPDPGALSVSYIFEGMWQAIADGGQHV